MKLIVEENTQKMSESALHILLGAMMQDKRVNISLTSGRSPIELYKMLAPEVRDQEKFKDIEYYLFDEAPYMDGKPYGPNWEEMQKLFFEEANIPEERIHDMTMENWETYDEEAVQVVLMSWLLVLVMMVISAATVLDVHQWIHILMQWIVLLRIKQTLIIQRENIFQSLLQWVLRA